MNSCVLPSVTTSLAVLGLLASPTCPACQTGSGSITNLPAIPNVSYQVFGLNPAGQLTGFYSVFGQHPAHAFLYDSGLLNDLGTFGGSASEGHALNSSGQVVGKANLAFDSRAHAFSFSGGQLADLGTLGGPSSSASGINDAGLIIGTSDLAGGAGSSAFAYANGVMSNLGNLGENYSAAFSLNNGGVIVGESGLANGDIHGFVYSGSGMADLGTLGGKYSSAFAINDAGEIVGESTVSSSDIHGFVYVNGMMTDVGTLGGTYSTAYGVNSNGLAIGLANTTDDSETHGFVYSGGTLTDLGTLGGTYSFVDAINNLGQIVGDSETATGADHAFLWEKGKMIDLNTLLPANSGWELVVAMYINDAGRVVGVGNYAGESQWFILDLAGGNNSPVAVAGLDQTVDCQTQVTLDGSHSSDPDNDPLTFEWSSGGALLGTSATLAVSLPLGTNLVTLKVTDTCGASAQSPLTVIVADTVPPTGSCPAPASASADANCQAAVPDFAAQVTASDNCTPPQALVISQSPASGTLVGLGQHPVTITVTDGSKNSSSCSVLFTVADTTPPAILSTPAPIALSAGSDCQAQVPDVLGKVVATDSCTPADQLIKVQTPAAGSLIGIGSHSILIAVFDAAGNKSTASVALTVADTTAPTILSGPSPISLSADANCQGAVPSLVGAVLATDNCTPANQIVLTQSPTAGTLLPRGVYSVTITAKDAAGNSSSIHVPLEIKDATAPVILSSPGPITLASDPRCKAAVPNVLASILAADNCTPANQLVMVQSPAAGTILPDGEYTVTVSVADASGNSTSVQVPLSIVDTTAPSFQSLTVSPNILSPPNHQLVAVTVAATVCDNCDASPLTKIVSITCNEATSPGDIQITGNLTALLAANKSASGGTRIYTITVQSTDASGNHSSAFVSVSVPKSSGNGGSNGASAKH